MKNVYLVWHEVQHDGRGLVSVHATYASALEGVTEFLKEDGQDWTLTIEDDEQCWIYDDRSVYIQKRAVSQ